MTYLLRRGPGSMRRVAHLATYNQFGEIAGSWCGKAQWNLSSNVPWGRPRCKVCLRKMEAAARAR